MKQRSYLSVSSLQFSLFFVYGCVIPVMGLYLTGELNFSGKQAGFIMALSSAAAFIAPVVGSALADRYISSEKLLSLMLAASSFFLFLLKDASAFAAVAVIFLLYSLFVGNTSALANAVIFHHLENRNDYGRIRIWGTIGWMAAAWFFGVIWLSPKFNSDPKTSDALVLASLTSAALSVGVFFMKPAHQARKILKAQIFPREAMRRLYSVTALKYAVIFFFAAVSDRIYIYTAAPYLKSHGFAESTILPMMTIGQIAEVLLMFYLSSVILRFGFRKVIIAGSLFNIAKFSMFAVPFSGFIFPGLFCHGATFALVFPPMTILIDRMCGKSDRAGVHQIYGIITGGLANIAGNLLTGFALDLFRNGGVVNFNKFWLFALAFAIVQLVLCFLFVKNVAAEYHPVNEISEI